MRSAIRSLVQQLPLAKAAFRPGSPNQGWLPPESAVEFRLETKMRSESIMRTWEGR